MIINIKIKKNNKVERYFGLVIFFSPKLYKFLAQYSPSGRLSELVIEANKTTHYPLLASGDYARLLYQETKGHSSAVSRLASVLKVKARVMTSLLGR
jgi:hypothetical protein